MVERRRLGGAEGMKKLWLVVKKCDRAIICRMLLHIRRFRLLRFVPRDSRSVRQLNHHRFQLVSKCPRKRDEADSVVYHTKG
jgi:hypothetical protein